ncbi:hypothetical protein THAOC_30361, partial [Thalassiosira oceanica]
EPCYREKKKASVKAARKRPQAQRTHHDPGSPSGLRCWGDPVDVVQFYDAALSTSPSTSKKILPRRSSFGLVAGLRTRTNIVPSKSTAGGRRVGTWRLNTKIMSDASEDDISLFFGLLSLVIAVIKACAHCEQNRATQESYDYDLLSEVHSNFLINESEWRAYPKETLQDGHEDFEYFSASQGDERSDRLKACVESSDWRALKDELSQLSSLSADDRGFYFQIVASAVREGWPTTRTEDLASFSPMLDDWVREEPDNTVASY